MSAVGNLLSTETYHVPSMCCVQCVILPTDDSWMCSAMSAITPTKCFQCSGMKKEHFLIARYLLKASLFSWTWSQRVLPKWSDNTIFDIVIITVTDYRERELYYYWFFNNTVDVAVLSTLYTKSNNSSTNIVDDSSIGILITTCTGMLRQLIRNIINRSSIGYLLLTIIVIFWNKITFILGRWSFCYLTITVLFLSLIHIWRCRRSYACRSRWSPYH